MIIPPVPNPKPVPPIVIVRPGVASYKSDFPLHPASIPQKDEFHLAPPVPPNQNDIEAIFNQIEEAERSGIKEVVVSDFDLMQKEQEFLDIIAKVIKSRLINLVFNNCKIPKDFNWVNKNSSLENTR